MYHHFLPPSGDIARKTPIRASIGNPLAINHKTLGLYTINFTLGLYTKHWDYTNTENKIKIPISGLMFPEQNMISVETVMKEKFWNLNNKCYGTSKLQINKSRSFSWNQTAPIYRVFVYFSKRVFLGTRSAIFGAHEIGLLLQVSKNILKLWNIIRTTKLPRPKSYADPQYSQSKLISIPHICHFFLHLPNFLQNFSPRRSA